MVGFVAFFAWLGFGGDYIYHLYTLDAPRRAYHHDFPWLGIGLSLVALALAWYAYKTGPDKVLWSTGARELLDPTDAKERSEEHTSELQSRYVISYAVFCLKK